jgi:hypothetical protein
MKLDLKKLHALKRRLKKLDGAKIEVGFFPEDKYDETGLSVAQVALFNEYGTSLVPTRPFMRDTFESGAAQRAIQNAMKNILSSTIRNLPVKFLFENLGKQLSEIMQQHIDGYPGSNSPSTIERKGFNDPLFNTGKVIESVKFQFHV